jgi:carbonic anhydrase/acetyltransferase-like protein (isoleucine patch superfamily)
MPVYALGERRVEFRGDEWFMAPDASVIGSVVIEHQANVWFNAVIRGDNERISIGPRVNVQDAAVLHADPQVPLTLHEDVCIGHKAMLHGCTVGAGSLIGMNAVLLNRSTLGAGCIVGAHTLIPEGKTFPEGVLVLGSPGKVVRDVTPEERAWILRIAAGYVKRARRFREALREQPLPAGAR